MSGINMREIKFRAWVPPISDGELTMPGYMTYELARQKYIATRSETREAPGWIGKEHIALGTYELNGDLASYGEKLMQFTGLQDKNSKEIWEGDIVLREKEDLPLQVVFNDGAFGLFDENNGMEDDMIFDADALEVIGNIYENPELITPS